MTKVYVSFSDKTESVVTAIFSSPQDDAVYANLGEVETTDERYIKFVEKINELQVQN